MSNGASLEPAYASERFKTYEDGVFFSTQQFMQGITQQFHLMVCLRQIAEDTGRYVQMPPQDGCLPILQGSDGEPVYLYHLVEGIEEFLNYDAVLEEYPTLNYTQIVGSLRFLRGVAQQNMLKIDLDAAEEQFTLSDEILNELRTAYENRENISDVFADHNE